jgi:ribose 1,5-bisphosphokinase PhnN
MRHCSVQVRGLLTRDELDRYNALIEVGHFLEKSDKYDLVAVVQKEIDILILPAIERLKEKGRQRDRDTDAYLARKAQMEAELAALQAEDDED